MWSSDFAAVDFRKKKQWDDALDVWGVHGMGGFTGTILIGIFATNSHLLTNPSSWYFLGIQVIGVIITAVYAYVLTTAILKISHAFHNDHYYKRRAGRRIRLFLLR